MYNNIYNSTGVIVAEIIKRKVLIFALYCCKLIYLPFPIEPWGTAMQSKLLVSSRNRECVPSIPE